MRQVNAEGHEPRLLPSRDGAVTLQGRSDQRDTRPPLSLCCHLPCATGSNRFRGFFGGVNRTSLATGLESRVMTISRSVRRRASASGQRWRRSLTGKVFTSKE